MTPSTRRAGDRAHAIALFAAGTLTCLYWVLFFLTDVTRPDFASWPVSARTPELPAVYDAFESAFPAADAFTGLCLAVAGLYVWAGDRLAALFGLVGSGALLFLALIDIEFNVLHGFYTPERLAGDVGLGLELAINLGCLGFGVFTLLRLWAKLKA
jgi:hypothetical protein